MTGMATHAKAPGKSSAKSWAWAVLLTMGATSVILNIWDATHAAHLFWLIAALKGIAPVGAAMGLSEVGARYDGGKVFRGLCFAVMGGAMSLSMSAIANVMRPGSEVWAAWMFGVVLDAAALIGLHVILTERERARAGATALEIADRAAADAQGDAERERRERAAAEAEAAQARAERDAVSAELEALRQAAPVPLRRRSRPAGARPRRSAPGAADTGDLTVELRAIQMLDAHPELRAKGNGAELGRRLGVHPSPGRRLHARLTAEERPDPLQERAPGREGERAPGTAQERPADQP
jgi:hypothetical protein